MKQTILILILSFSAIYSKAQCDKCVTCISGKAEFIGNAGKVERTGGRIVKLVSDSHEEDKD